MHEFHRADTAVDYARTASCRTTEVIALPGYGDCLRIEKDDEGYLNVSFPSGEDLEAEEARRAKAEANGSDLPLDEAETLLSEDDPFLESDLPVTSLADEENEDPRP